MKRFVLLSVIIVITTVILALTTEMGSSGSISETRILGAPVVTLADDTFSWIAFGAGAGVIVLGAGVGVVAFTVIGAGLLFGTGQVTAGCIAMGQAGLGLVAFLGQAGTGLVGAGQVVIGALGWAQGRLAMDGEQFIKDLNADLNETLKFR
jgi:hypothetical protein